MTYLALGRGRRDVLSAFLLVQVKVPAVVVNVNAAWITLT